MSEADERFPVGPRGAQGKQGERGERGLSWRVRVAIVALFGLNFVGIGVNLLWTSIEVNANAATQHQQQVTQQRQAAAEQAAQRAQGELLEQKLCKTLEPFAGLAGLKPPPGNPADNPARAFEQQLVVKLAPLAQLGPDLGCKP